VGRKARASAVAMNECCGDEDESASHRDLRKTSERLRRASYLKSSKLSNLIGDNFDLLASSTPLIVPSATHVLPIDDE
jgi:hypothetical protein